MADIFWTQQNQGCLDFSKRFTFYVDYVCQVFCWYQNVHNSAIFFAPIRWTSMRSNLYRDNCHGYVDGVRANHRTRNIFLRHAGILEDTGRVEENLQN